jgi:Domain of unknown function (DUF6504)
MRRYADPVEVRQGPLESDARGLGAHGASEGPQQFLWRGRLWKVRAVLAHWVETGPWWQSTGARAAIGDDTAGSQDAAEDSTERGRIPLRPSLGDLLTERELWRVEAGRPRPPAITPDGDTETGISGVFDLSFDWADGRWTLVGCTD